MAEHPELGCRLVDLAPGESEAGVLCDLLLSPSVEDQMAIRGQECYSARLVRFRPATGAPFARQIVADGTYLITGGMGGLGWQMAEWLVEQGARHLVLAGRSAATDDRIAELAERGVRVLAVQADVARLPDVTALLEQIRSSMPPLRGIIHAAGVLADASLPRQTREGLARVMAPKVAGAWNLHLMTRGEPLDFFVLFSSAASLLGNSGQANYAAANAFLDALAAYRRNLGLPGLSINWGAWLEVGAAAELARASRLRSKGFGAITNQQGRQFMARLLAQDAAQIGVLPIDWSVLLSQLPAGAAPPSLLADLFRQHRPAAGRSANSFVRQDELLRQLRELGDSDSRALLTGYLKERVAAALGLDSLDEADTAHSLSELGLDSLMGIDLKHRIAVELDVDVPMDKLLDGTGIAGLVQLLREQIALSNLVSPNAGQAGGQIEGMEEFTL